MLKDYYTLTKPGIIYGNALAAIGGFFLASKGDINFIVGAAMLVGLSLIIASGCVFNNYIDRDIDKVMERTKNRALVAGRISPSAALTYAAILGLAGAALLAACTNFLTLGLALFGLFAYVVLYSMWGKRGSTYGTIVGSISGSIPPVVGYCAVTGRFDLGALLLFAVLCLWQMPHFYAIAMYRLTDYSAAKVPVLPTKGILRSKIHILLYVIAFTIAAVLLTTLGYTGYSYLVVMGVFCAGWLFYSVQGFWTPNTTKWGRHMFHYSLFVLLAFCLMISITSLLP